MAWPHLEKAKHQHNHTGPEARGKIKRRRPKTPGGVTSMQISSKQGMAGKNWRGLLKTGGAGEMLWMVNSRSRF